jgi:CMP/dCMP kinase
VGPRGLVIAIDGPAGSGKSTLAKALARRLGYRYIDTGAMYRCVSLAAQRRGVSFEDTEALAKVAEGIRIELQPGEVGMHVYLDGEEVDNLIRTPEISALTSQKTANAPGVRKALVARQQAMGREGGVVMEGRDIGSVVFPDADLKVYFNVSVNERSRRRIEDFQRRGIPFEASTVHADIERRDQEDRNRPIGPLIQAAGARRIEGDGKSVEETLGEILALLPPGILPPHSPDLPERP